jgi:8-oxo-dGTP diphosphatase
MPPRSRSRLVVAAVITSPEGRVLTARRRPGSHLEGLWEFPGGGVEDGETAEEALIRELREELGVEIEVGEPLTFAWHREARFEVLLLFYRASIVRGRLEALEGQELRWFAPAELVSLATPPADARLVAALADGTIPLGRP